MPPIYSKKKARKGKLAKKFGAVKAKREVPEVLNVALLLVVISITIFLLVGGLYDTFARPPMVISTNQRMSFFIPFDTSSQTLSESIFTAMLSAVGAGGLMIAYKSIKSGRTARLTSIALIGGMAMLIIGVLGIQLLLKAKIG